MTVSWERARHVIVTALWKMEDSRFGSGPPSASRMPPKLMNGWPPAMCWARSCCGSVAPPAQDRRYLELLKIGGDDEFERLDNHVVVRIRWPPIFFRRSIQKRLRLGDVAIHEKQ